MTATFTWRVTTVSSGGGQFVTSNMKFGDGYSQEVGSGIGSEIQRWSVTCVADKTEALEILEFLRENKGKAFYWKPPVHELGFYKVVGQIKPTNQGGKLYTIALEFVQVFGVEHEP